MTKQKNSAWSSLRRKKDEAMHVLEIKFTQETLNRDEGNTMRRYLDNKLRKELNYPPRKQFCHVKSKQSSVNTSPKWDASIQSFIVYHCTYHRFDLDDTTIETKCFQRNCGHLTTQRKKEIMVKTLREALALKKRTKDVQIEQTPSGYLLRVL
jgi:hypothetical protein